MISRVDFDNYNKAVADLTNLASQDAQRQISAWMQLNPDASVAEIRNFAKETMDGLVQVYGETASSLAAQWYDFEAGKAGKKLPVAITETTYDADQVKRVAHYQAKKLADGDINGFLDACGEYMENATKQSLNNTILANVKRDKEQGVRFARVTTGAETCSFCYMLSSRGAVYYSRHSAGEQNHYHRGCDCKIVPGFEDDPDAAIVEGYDPKGMRDRMALIEEQTGLRFGGKSDMSALSSFMKLHDSQWLINGNVPDIDYLFNSRKNYGTLENPDDYSEENIVDKGEEWRDLFAIDILQKNGFSVATRPNQIFGNDDIPIEGATSPDLWIGGELWEIKSPKASNITPKKGNELKYIDNQFKQARHNFLNPYNPKTKSPEVFDGKRRVVLNLKYRPTGKSHEETIEVILKAMKNRSIDSVLYIAEDGKIFYLEN